MLLKRLFHLLALLGLLLAPMGMLGEHAAMAMPQYGTTMAMSHCDEQEQQPQDHERKSMIDCVIACSAMPAAAELLAAPRVRILQTAFETAPLLDIEGTRPEAATPPPRTT